MESRAKLLGHPVHTAVASYVVSGFSGTLRTKKTLCASVSPWPVVMSVEARRAGPRLRPQKAERPEP